MFGESDMERKKLLAEGVFPSLYFFSWNIPSPRDFYLRFCIFAPNLTD
jgi:hypothetical protein